MVMIDLQKAFDIQLTMICCFKNGRLLVLIIWPLNGLNRSQKAEIKKLKLMIFFHPRVVPYGVPQGIHPGAIAFFNIYGSSHTKLCQWLILRVVVFEHILSIFISIAPA